MSGEDELTEVSHVERSLMIKMPKDGRNREALFSLLERRDDGFPMVWEQGFGRAYLDWLMALPYEYRMPPLNTDRKTLGEQMARWGYDLLTTFIEYMDPDISMPKFDYSQVNRDQKEALSANPVVEAIVRGSR